MSLLDNATATGLRDTPPATTGETWALLAHLIENTADGLDGTPLTEDRFLRLTEHLTLPQRQAIALELSPWAQRAIGAWTE